jgi:Tol biopolymer transport system component
LPCANGTRTLPVPREGGILDDPAAEPHGHGGAIMPRWVTGALAHGLAMALGVGLPALGQETIERASLGPGGVESNGSSRDPALSADGRFVAFTSSATNLVADDTNRRSDVFVRDRETATTERVSLGPNGHQGNGHSGEPALSADGRFVAFVSSASNLVPGDTNAIEDVFVHDRRTGVTERVSNGLNGSQPNSYSEEPALSADGRLVAFTSRATNLVPSDTNNAKDVFVHDRRTRVTRRVNVGPNGRQANGDAYVPALSATGRFVAFASAAGNLIYGDTNGWDVFVHDRRTGSTERASVGPAGRQADSTSYWAALSATGRFVAFTSHASNLVPGDTNGTEDVFVRDRLRGTTERVSLGPNGQESHGSMDAPLLSADGRVVAFVSDAPDLASGDTDSDWDIFVRDRRTGTTARVADNDANLAPALSADGRVVAFQSWASDLVPGDTNNQMDVFVRRLAGGR